MGKSRRDDSMVDGTSFLLFCAKEELHSAEINISRGYLGVGAAWLTNCRAYGTQLGAG